MLIGGQEHALQHGVDALKVDQQEDLLARDLYYRF